MGDSRFVQVVNQFAIEMAEQARIITAAGPQVVQRLPGDEGFRLCGQQSIPDILIAFREQDLHRNDSPPRIVFVPVGGEIASPDGPGARKDAATGQVIYQRRRRMFSMRVNCWGADQKQAEDLVHNSILALESIGEAGGGTGPADTAFSDERWESQEAGEGGQLTFGYLISFTATIQISVTSLPNKLLQVENVRLIVNELDQQEIIDI